MIATASARVGQGEQPAVPGEFRYWSNIERPAVRRARRIARALLGFDPAPTDEQVRAFAASYYDADPLAEAFVDEMSRDGFAAGREMLDRTLRDGVDSVEDAPASLRALFADIEEDPPWLDRDKVAAGARCFRRYGSDVFHFAGAVTLQAYRENSVAKPLVLTGGYAGNSARRRFLETASFWIDVSEPGALWAKGAGREAALRVRIMHVFVRQRLLQHPEWRSEEWGVPISQGDALLTLMGGSIVPGIALQAMGYRPSREEIDAMMHFWRYVGHLMGVRPRWFPANLKEAIQLLFASFVKGADRAGDDGVQLSHSYLRLFEPAADDRFAERIRGGLRHRMHMGFTRFFLPPPSYKHFGLPRAGLWGLHPLMHFPLIFAAESARRALPALGELADARARRERRRWLERRTRGERARYRPVERFTR
jgi:hypothetical protein